MLKVLYLTRTNFSLRRAHAHNILKTAEALSKVSGLEITLVTNKPLTKELPVVLTEHNILDPLFIFFRTRLPIWLFTIMHLRDYDVCYTREFGLWSAILIAKIFGKKTFFEIHRLPKKNYEYAEWAVLKRIPDGIVAITAALKRSLGSFDTEIIVSHCAASEPELFDYGATREELRKKLNLPLDKFLVCSMGTFQLYKMESLYEGFSISNKKMALVLLGVKDSEILGLQAKFKMLGVVDRIFMVTRVPYLKTPEYLLAADVLLIPEGEDTPGFAPTKMYEYLAAGRPIVSYKNEAISEVLQDGKSALFVDPPTPENWADALGRIFNSKEFSESIAKEALSRSKEFTWRARGEIIAKLIKGDVQL